MFTFDLCIDGQWADWVEDNWTETARTAWEILADIAAVDGLEVPVIDTPGEFRTDRLEAVVIARPLSEGTGRGHAIRNGRESDAPSFDGPATVAWDTGLGEILDWPEGCEVFAIDESRDSFVVRIIRAGEPYRWAQPIDSRTGELLPFLVAVVGSYL